MTILLPPPCPAGELNWVFTAITDTIAWNVLPRALFQKLFRQVSWRWVLPGAGVCWRRKSRKR